MNVPAKSFAEIFNSGSWQGQQKFTDCALQTNDRTTFRIHRVVLTQSSEYFRKLFNTNLKKEIVVIPNIDCKILESILVYIYTGTIALDEKNVCDLMVASDFLLLDDLMKRCHSFAIQNMTSTSCLSSLSIACQFERLTITKDCYRYAVVHFTDILETSNGGLEELPFEILNKMLESKSLNVTSERTVWEAIISWTEANSSIRLSHVPALLTCLKLDEEVDENLAAEILSHAIVSRNPHCFGFMSNNQLNFHTLKNTILSHHPSLDPLFQKSQISYDSRTPNSLHLIARRTESSRFCRELFLSYDNEFDFCGHIRKTYSFVDMMTVIGQRIYIYAWYGISYIIDIVEEALVDRDEVLMTLPSRNGWTITLGGKSYHIDGCVVCRYEFERNRWQRIATACDILIKGASALNNRIFIVGVHELDDVMMCQAYDPETKTWISLPAPNIFRPEFSVVANQEQVFVVPKYWEDVHPEKVEVYDPLENTWMSLPDLPFEYRSPKAVVVDDKIIVYENNEEQSRRYQNVNPPVYWDESARLWTIIDESSPWYNIEQYSFLALDDSRLVKDLTAKNRRPGIKWERILLA
ncbi:Kelch-like protein 17 [Araneus ventricosus]|uniref:Kelch-like protein 17 n=1 Tax=Araneus ventricosus TaxID=182803 RepID=A0A4Y2NIG6_ARAVE|nr:Kelch-like protein 17 [Araneus ventricosus]